MEVDQDIPSFPAKNGTATREQRASKDLRKNVKRPKKMAVAPVKLNKRLLHMKRDNELRALPVDSTTTDISSERHLEEEEFVNCKWSKMEHLDESGTKMRKRRRDESVNTQPIDKKRKCDSESENELESENEHESSDGERSDESSEEEEEESYDEEEEEGISVDEQMQMIDGLMLTENTNKKKGKTVAWWEVRDPKLLDTDVIVPEDVEVDMDKVYSVLQDENSTDKCSATKERPSLKLNQALELSKSAVAIDCEMVGVGEGGTDSSLARVTLVDSSGGVLYNEFVQQPCKVTDYRTKWSGIRPQDLIEALPFKQVQRETADLIKDKILVAHDIRNDMKALRLSHPYYLIRDTCTYDRFRKKNQGFTPSLRALAKDYLGMSIQSGEHDSAEDARAAMRLYLMYKVEWETKLSKLGRESHRKFAKVNEKRKKRRSAKNKKGKLVRKPGKYWGKKKK